MNKFTSYQYAANNADSYKALATYVINTPANVSLFPGKLTLVVAPSPEYPDVVKELGAFIDNEALDFHISPIDGDIDEILAIETVDTDSLRHAIDIIKSVNEEDVKVLKNRLNDCEHDLNRTNKDKNAYFKWWQESRERENRVKSQVQAIAVLINSIFLDKD